MWFAAHSSELARRNGSQHGRLAAQADGITGKLAASGQLAAQMARTWARTTDDGYGSH